MTYTKSKTALQFILGGIMLVSVATIGCNDNSTTTEPASKEETPAPAPAAIDTTQVIDTASTRPIVPTN